MKASSGSASPAPGVVDEPRDELLGHGEAPELRGSLDHQPERVAAQRRERLDRRVQLGERGVGEHRAEELRPQRRHDADRPGEPGGEQCGEPGPLVGRGQRHELLELVDDDQQVPPGAGGVGEEQVVGEVAQPVAVEPGANLRRGPSQIGASRRDDQRRGQRLDRVGAGDERG